MTDTPRRDDAATLERFGYAQELKRQLTLKDLLIYGLVSMVPTAPFSIFGGVFDISAGMVPLTYLVGFMAMLFTALSYQQMSQAFPVAGSVYAYVGRGLNSGMGFLAGWAILLDYLLVPTLLYVVGANAMYNVVPAVPQPVWIGFFVVLNTVVNLRGIETTARANRFFCLGSCWYWRYSWCWRRWRSSAASMARTGVGAPSMTRKRFPHT